MAVLLVVVEQVLIRGPPSSLSSVLRVAAHSVELGTEVFRVANC